MKVFAYFCAFTLVAGTAIADQSGGSQSTSAFAMAHFAQSHESGDGSRRIDGAGRTMSVGVAADSVTEQAALHFATDHETGDGPKYVRVVDDSVGIIFSTSRPDLANQAAAKLDNGERGDN